QIGAPTGGNEGPGTLNLAASPYVNGTQTSLINNIGTGLTLGAGSLTNNAEWNYLGRVNQTTTVADNVPIDFVKVKVASTLDSCTASTGTYTCTTGQTFAIVDCGSSTTCASPTTLCSVQVTAAATAFQVASPAVSTIAAGDYIAAESLSGACTVLSAASIQGQIHSN